MGYRSDVAIALYAARKEDAPAIKLWIEENFPFNYEEVKEDTKWFDRGIVYSALNVKWYDSYEDVQAIEAACHRFNELFCRHNSTITGAYEMVRIGEEHEDIETEYGGSCDYMLGVHRQITIELEGNNENA